MTTPDNVVEPLIDGEFADDMKVRERFAMAAMQAILTNKGRTFTLIEDSVEIADELIEELRRTDPGKAE